MAGAVVDLRADGARVAQPPALSCLEQRQHPLVGLADCAVEQRAFEARDRDRVDERCAKAAGVAGGVAADPCQAVGPRGGDVDQPARGAPQVPERRRVAMAEPRPVAAAEHRRQPASLEGQAAVADRVDAAVQAQQRSGRNPAVYRALTQTERAQLRP
jgi:hypothetical protein